MSGAPEPSSASPVRWFRRIAVVEAVSYLALVGASVAKRAFDVQGLVPIVGPIHGVIFLAYLAAVFLVREELGWEVGHTLLVLGAAIIPLGGFYAERRLLGAPG